MLSLLPRSTETLVEDLEAQVANLRKELSSLRRQASKRGAHAYDDASELASGLYDTLARSGAEAGRGLARNAHRVNDAARANPLAVGVVGLALLAAAGVLLSRR